MNDYARKNGGAQRLTVFFRGQLLELIRWIVLFSDDFPEDGTTFENPEIRRNFAKAVLIAGDIWSKRVFGENRFSLDGGITIARKRALGAIRKSVESASRTPILLKSIGRGWALFSQYFSRYHKIKPRQVFTAPFPTRAIVRAWIRIDSRHDKKLRQA